MDAAFRYVPGMMTAVAGGDTAVLVDVPLNDARIAEIQRLAHDGASFDEVLDALISRGLRSLDTFGILQRVNNGIRVLVRGQCQAIVPGHTGVTSTGTWTDIHIAHATGARLTATSPGAPLVPLGWGTVAASAIELGQMTAESTPGSTPREVHMAEPPLGTAAPSDPLPRSPKTQEAQLPREPEEEVDAPNIDFDRLFGETMHPSHAEEELARADNVMTDAAPLPTASASSSPLSSAQSDAAPTPSSPASPPSESEPQADPSQPAAPAAPVPPTPNGPPMVFARRCARGHLNPGYIDVCRMCSRPLPPESIQVPRPSLGVLRLANGSSVKLDRGVVLGRNPKVTTDYAGEQPHLVQLRDPNRDISSQHLAVQLDYWRVLVTDLGSTNGTEIVVPGQPPIMLNPHDPVVIEPGTRVVLAGVFELTYEV